MKATHGHGNAAAETTVAKVKIMTKKAMKVNVKKTTSIFNCS